MRKKKKKKKKKGTSKSAVRGLLHDRGDARVMARHRRHAGKAGRGGSSKRLLHYCVHTP